MRPIKFRAWLKKEKRMIEVAGVEFTPRGITAWEKLDEEMVYLPDDVVVMQFTGLLDKNGREIYEGDICRISGHRRIVEWKMENNMTGFNVGGIADESHREFIGNIHENPELVKP